MSHMSSRQPLTSLGIESASELESTAPENEAERRDCELLTAGTALRRSEARYRTLFDGFPLICARGVAGRRQRGSP